VTAPWANPELLRNARIQLRPGRAIAAAIICAAVSLTIWYSFESHGSDQTAAFDAITMFKFILQMQVSVLLIGGGIYELLTVHREKELNTFDYQRVTRLSSFELAIGKLFGAPILTYFIVLCLMPIAIFAAVLGHAPLAALVEAYAILLVGCVAFHLLALLISTTLGRGVSAIAVLPYLILVAFTSSDYFPERGNPAIIQTNWAFHQLNPFAASGAFQSDPPRALVDIFFGVSVSHFIVLMVIYVTLGAWFLLAIVRNLKRDPAVYELYSPIQAFGFAIYLNLLMLGFFNWKSPAGQPIFGPSGQLKGFEQVPPGQIEEILLRISFWLFALLGIVLLRNRERVRQRIQVLGERAAGFWAALWPAPYVLAGMIIAGLGILELIRVYRDVSGADWDWGLALVSIAFFALWLARDLLYLQWMGLRRTRRPLASAIIYLIVFYTCTGVIFGVAHVLLRQSVAPYSAMLIPSGISSLLVADWAAHYQLWLVALAVLAAEALLFAFLQRQKLREFITPPVVAPVMTPRKPSLMPR
jgi:Ca2+/Na+ antiporter